MTNSADLDLQKPADLDLHCLQKQGISRFSRTRVKRNGYTFKGGNSLKIVLPSFWKSVYSKLEKSFFKGSKLFCLNFEKGFAL